MRNVPTQVERHKQETCNGMLTHGMSGYSTIVICTQSAVLGNGTQTVHHSPHRELRDKPESYVNERVRHKRNCNQQHKLSDKNFCLCSFAESIFSQWMTELVSNHFEPSNAQCIASHFSPETVARDRVVGVQRNIGFVWSELFTMMRHVYVAVCIRIDE